jgi:hypothetical protein
MLVKQHRLSNLLSANLQWGIKMIEMKNEQEREKKRRRFFVVYNSFYSLSLPWLGVKWSGTYSI